MQYGLYMPNFGYYGDPRRVADLAREAEQAGWDGFFMWDHIALDWAQLPMVDVWVTLAAAAVQTQTIRLGALVTPLPRRRPWKFARETVTLDHLSGGRLIAGVGIGLGAGEWDHLGEERDQVVRGQMLDEALEVVTGLWSGQPFSYQGPHYTVSEAHFLPEPVQQPRIPIWVGGFWPHKAPFRRAAAWDGVFPLFEEFGDIERQLFRAAVDYTRAHRTTDGPFDIVYVGAPTPGDDPAQGAEIVAPFAEMGATWWLENISTWREGPDHAEEWTFERLRERVLQGPPKP